jgi:hypothetical protein
MEKDPPDAVIVQPSLPGRRAAELALKHRVPAVSVGRWFAEEGGLMSYSAISDAVVEPIRGYGALGGARWYHVGFVVHKAYDAGLGNCSIMNVSYTGHWADTLIEPGRTSEPITVPRLGTEFPQGFNVSFKSKPTDWRPIRFRVECKGAISNTLEANFEDYFAKTF